MEKSFYITTPIYYVNAPPHLGHAYTTIVADVIARYYKMAGYRTYFLTGTDEHGEKVVQAAQMAGVSPNEYVDRISSIFKALWPDLGISYDYFIRTTDPDHIRVVQYILNIVYEKGDIYFGEYGGLYCYGCERFYLERELVDGKCPDHNKEPIYIQEENYFFRMSRYQDWLVKYITENKDFIRPERYRNEVLSFLKEPLEDLCISRPKSRLQWGIPLPFDERYVTYVWFDALINYISALGYPDGEKFRIFWPHAQHLIAKDILKPHAIYWPIILKAAGIQPFKHLNVHGYWSVDESKMSKTLGNVIRPLDLKEKYGLDAFRYFLMREMVFGLDSNFSEEALINRINSDLANDLGNLVLRSLVMVERYFDGIVPEPSSSWEKEDEALKDTAREVLFEYRDSMESFSFQKALIAIWRLIGEINRYIDRLEPWRIAKDPNQRDRLKGVIYNICESIRIVAVLLFPFMPETSLKIIRQLGIEYHIETKGLEAISKWGGLKAGVRIKKAEALFPRIEKGEGIKIEKTSNITSQRGKSVTDIKGESNRNGEKIGLREFQKLDMRVGRIISAERIKGSDKLLCLQVDLGERKVQIVSGIAGTYSPDILQGKLCIVIANIMEVEIMGFLSEGMILSAGREGKSYILTVDGDLPPGTRVS